LVRIAEHPKIKKADTAEAKSKLNIFAKNHDIKFSTEVYKIDKIQGPTIFLNNNKTYAAWEILKVSKPLTPVRKSLEVEKKTQEIKSDQKLTRRLNKEGLEKSNIILEDKRVLRSRK